MLSPKKRKFCEEYIANGSNAQLAALEAGYGTAEDLKGRHVASQSASRMLKEPEVLEYINDRTKEIFEQLGISPERIAVELWKTYQRCSRAVEVTDRNGEPTGEWTFDAKNALTSLQRLGEYKGMFIQKVEASVSNPLKDISDAKLKALIDLLEKEET